MDCKKEVGLAQAAFRRAQKEGTVDILNRAALLSGSMPFLSINPNQLQKVLKFADERTPGRVEYYRQKLSKTSRGSKDIDVYRKKAHRPVGRSRFDSWRPLQR